MRQAPPNFFGVSKSKIIWAASILIVATAVYIVWNKSFPARYARAADKAYLKATQTIDPEQLRVWAIQSISKYPITNKYLGSQIPKLEIPSQIQHLWPTEPYVFVERQQTNSEEDVVILWDNDSLRGNWWLTIGSVNFQQFSNSEVSCSFYQKAVWAPGIFYNRYPK